ncbi:MAG: hypothetical protein QMD66_04725 [Actinomycetota bacterium]|nr:hypothetical protein [Actinomycetota bacterium]MDI6822156.1 hypothetical protein [Actinomycetota bacterium]
MDASKNNEGYEVLELFGIKLKVKNPRIAKILTMDAKEVLTEDIRVLRKKLAEPDREESGFEEIPSISEIESHSVYRKVINSIGKRLEFDVNLGDLWRSTTGMTIIVKAIKDGLNFNQARKYVSELATQQSRIRNENAGLFIVGDNISCDILKAAIRSQNLYHLMRVISYENFNQILQLKEGGYLNHKGVVTLMVPLDNIDVGELINVIKAAAAPAKLEKYFAKRK